LLAFAACRQDPDDQPPPDGQQAPQTQDDGSAPERCPARDVVRSGHRGSGRNAADNPLPENTLPSVIAAAEAGADSVEVDVTYTSDGVLVALHDDTVDRTTDGTGCAASFTRQAIQQLDAARGTPLAGTGVTIPTLDEVLDALDVDVNIEIKVAEAPCAATDIERLADDVAAAIARDDEPREIIVSSFSAETLALLVERDIELVLHRRNPALAAELGIGTVNVAPDERIAESIAAAHEYDLDTLTVTADPERIRAALQAGVGTILTDDLELTAALQREVCDAE
jgi:glycerophosphoryl diester phosphodiesterase